MSAHIAILDSPGTLRLSEEAQAALHLHAGSRIAVTIEEGKVTLQPAEEDDLVGNPPSPQTAAGSIEERECEAKARVERITNELREMFAGQPSLEDEYHRTRDVDKW